MEQGLAGACPTRDVCDGYLAMRQARIRSLVVEPLLGTGTVALAASGFSRRRALVAHLSCESAAEATIGSFTYVAVTRPMPQREAICTYLSNLVILQYGNEDLSSCSASSTTSNAIQESPRMPLSQTDRRKLAQPQTPDTLYILPRGRLDTPTQTHC